MDIIRISLTRRVLCEHTGSAVLLFLLSRPLLILGHREGGAGATAALQPCVGRKPYQPTHAFRTQRCLTYTHVKRTEGVLHGIGDRCWRGNGTAFAHALDAERVTR